MRFFVSAEWTRNDLLKTIVWCFLVYTLILWLTNFGMWFGKMGLTLSPSSLTDYYLGNEDRFLQPRSLAGLLEMLHFHAFAMGILLLTLTHLLLFVPLSPRLKAWGIAVSFVAGLGGELSGWGIRFVHPVFAWAKIAFFLMLQGTLLGLMAVVARALWTAAPSAYGSAGGRPPPVA